MSVSQSRRPILHKLNPDKAQGSWRTICEVQRELYRAVRDGAPKENVLGLIEEAYDLGKRMHFRLVEYKSDYHDEICERKGA